MIGGNGWCGWPAIGGGGALEAWEQWIPACQFALPPCQSNFRENVWYNVALNADQDAIAFPQESEANTKFLFNDNFKYTDPGIEIKMVWEEENGSHGINYDWYCGLIIYENKQTITLARNPLAVVTQDGSANDDDIIITDLTANLDFQYKPNPLTGPPFYCHLWIYRGSDEASGSGFLHGVKIKYNLITS